MRYALALAAAAVAAAVAVAVGCTSSAAPVTPAPIGPTRDEPTAAPPPAPSESELSAQKQQVNRLYDQQDFEGAIAGAEAILANVPDDVRMRRVAASAHCLLGNADEARGHWTRLPERDRQQIATRCQRFGVTLP